MAIDLRERAPAAPAVEPVVLPRRRTKVRDVAVWLLVSILIGVAAGAAVYGLVTGGDEAARAARIQELRAEATVRAYEHAWAAVKPTETRVRITGTGPGLTWVAEQQAAWAEHAITGTGPGLVTVAQMQAGYEPVSEPTGTGPGLERLSGQVGQEVAVIGTP